MIDNNITINMKNLTEDERELLMKLIEKANKVENDVWKPACGEIFYFLYSDGKIGKCHYADDFAYEIGNCFRTKEEAKFELERLKILTKMKRIAAKDKEIEWDCKHSHYYIVYSIYSDSEKPLFVESMKGLKQNDIYFASEERAEECIKAIGEDRLKKYYFKV